MRGGMRSPPAAPDICRKHRTSFCDQFPLFLSRLNRFSDMANGIVAYPPSCVSCASSGQLWGKPALQRSIKADTEQHLDGV